jgi:hypothetical protein
MPMEPEMIVTRLDHEPKDIKQERREKTTNNNKHITGETTSTT